MGIHSEGRNSDLSKFIINNHEEHEEREGYFFHVLHDLHGKKII